MAVERRLERRCLRCDEAFSARRITARYCANRCRQMAYLRRRHPPGEMGPFTWADFEAILWRPSPPDRD
jgi:hypothetical protein